MEIKYAGFWKRLGAHLIDSLIVMGVAAPTIFLGAQGRLIRINISIALVFFLIFYSFYLVKKYGGTPGKLAMGLKIRDLSGGPINAKQAFLRYSVEFVINLLATIAGILALLTITDAQYAAMSFMEQLKFIAKAQPVWGTWAAYGAQVWVWSEFLVLLLNSKKRAPHDFIAGTIVVDESKAAV